MKLSNLNLDELLALDDERYWDALRDKGVSLPPVMLMDRIPWKEILHPRGRGGRFRDKPDLPHIARALGRLDVRPAVQARDWESGDTYSRVLARAGGKAEDVAFPVNYDGVDSDLAEKIKAAKTAEEIAVAMSIRYHNTDFDFSHLNVDTMRDVAAQYARMADQFPEVAANMKYVGSGQEPENDLYNDGWRGERTTWAYAGKNAVGRGASLHLNPFWFGSDGADFRKNLQENVANGWHAEGGDTPASIVTHEFGHHVDWWITGASSTLLAHQTRPADFLTDRAMPELPDGTRVDLAHEEFRRELHRHPDQVSQPLL